MKDYERIDKLEKDVETIKSKLWLLVGNYEECLRDALNIIKDIQRDRE